MVAAVVGEGAGLLHPIGGRLLLLSPPPKKVFWVLTNGNCLFYGVFWVVVKRGRPGVLELLAAPPVNSRQRLVASRKVLCRALWGAWIETVMYGVCGLMREVI